MRQSVDIARHGSTMITGTVRPARFAATSALRFTSGCALKGPSHGIVKSVVPSSSTTRCDLRPQNQMRPRSSRQPRSPMRCAMPSGVSIFARAV